MTALALDTNVVISILNGSSGLVIARYEAVFLPIRVCGELLFGAMNSGQALQNLEKARQFIERYSVLDINEIVAERYAEVRHLLKLAGRPIPENDVWIAATCLVYEVPLATNDGHFE